MALTVECAQEKGGRWLAEVLEGPGVLAYGQTSDEAIAKFQQELAGKNYKYLNPGIERNEDIGLKTIETIDPFGNRIRFSEDLDSVQNPER